VIATTRNQVENQVWSAYSTARTVLRKQKAAAALLAAASACGTSWDGNEYAGGAKLYGPCPMADSK
jgi:hypothetical protein